MTRSVSGRRPDGALVYASGVITEKVEAFGFDRDRAGRIVAIAAEFGLDSEALPDGLMTVRRVPGGYTIEVQR